MAGEEVALISRLESGFGKGGSSFGEGKMGLSEHPARLSQRAKLGDHCTQVKNKAETLLQEQVTGVLPPLWECLCLAQQAELHAGASHL